MTLEDLGYNIDFESTVAEKRKKDKDFGKMIKNYKKAKN